MCRWGSQTYVFSPRMVGCSGAVRWAERASLCAAGVPCTAEQWVNGAGGRAAAHNFWTADDLRYLGAANDCWVSKSSGEVCNSSTA